MAASWNYQLSWNQKMTVSGIDPDDASAGVRQDVPLGALVGINIANGRAGDWFAIGAGIQQVLETNGLLYVQVNVSGSAKCAGTEDLHLSGDIAPANRRRSSR